MKRAIEASKRQADEDDRKRRGVHTETDDDLARAIKLSKEEEEMRQSRLQDENSNLLFDDSMDQPVQQQQPLYQQQQEVDFFGNPVNMNPQQQQQQSTGYLANVYSQPTGFLPQATGYLQPQSTSNGFQNGFQSNNPYAQPQFAPQQTSFPTGSPMSNNPYAQQQQAEPLQPMPTGSNNPFAQFGKSFDQAPSPARQTFSPSLSTLSEQQPQTKFSLSPQNTSYTQSTQSYSQSSTPQKPQSAHTNKLDYLLSQGNPMGQDTFGNTGELRVPAHYQRTGFVNSAGQGLRPSMTGVPPQNQNNPFAGGQSSGVRPLTQSSTGPAYQNSPFGQYGQQSQQQQTGSLIDF
jgi:epsin